MDSNLLMYGIPAVILVGGAIAYFVLIAPKRQRLEQRIARATRKKVVVARKNSGMMNLRKAKEGGIPVIGKMIQSFASMNALKARIEKAGLTITPDIYIVGSAGAFLLITLVMVVLHKPLAMAIIVALLGGVWFPHFYLNFKGNKRIKRFLTLFPDAIDFIVRGLRSGLPVTESMNMVGGEMEEPIGSIFAGMGESVRLGVPVEKALTDTANKLKSTEFNFFVTSIILQRETGGNLSEILSNLSDVLRKRFMMRMKIKAMSSEAKASAIIVGSLPFVVILALTFVSPNYLDPLYNDPRGHIAAGAACTSLMMGIGIMIKMTKFEI